MAQTLKFGNKVWAAKEDSVLAYNDINNNYKPLPFSFSRASIGTRVNKAGLIETMGQDIARIDYTDSADGVLLLENAATNLYPYSNKSSEWLKTNWTTTDNYAISPDGTQNAFRAVSLNNSGILYISGTGSSGVNTLSVYAKSNTSTNQKFRFFANGNTLSSDDFTVTNEWKRIEFSYTFSSVTSGIKGASNELSDILFFGFQQEVNDLASSYIPTQGSAVTRVAETCNNSGNSEVFNDSEGVLFADIAALVNSGNSRRISISHPSYDTNNRVTLEVDEATSTIKSFMSSGGSTVGSLTVNNINQIQNNKIAVVYKANTFEIYINGFLSDSDFSVASLPVGLSRIQFEGANGSNDFYGKTKELGYYNTALTDAELETLTSYRNWVSMVNELNLNIIYNG
jgi:hypothetical protein